MRAMAVVVPGVAVQDPFEMSFIENEELVEAFRSHAADEPLRGRVGIRSLIRRLEDLSTFASEDVVEAGHVLGVTIVEQKPELDVFFGEVERDVPRLLGDPGRMGMGRDASDPNPSPSELEKEEHVEPAEGHGVDGEEIGGDDARRLSSQELAPRRAMPPWGGPEAAVFQDPSDRARSQCHAEFDQLTLDPAVAPPRVLPSEAYDELGRLRVDRWSTWSAVSVRPATGHEPAMPCQQRRRRHPETAPRTAREEATERREKRSVCRLVGGTSGLASENGDLVAESEQLDLFGPLGANEENDELKETAQGKVGEGPELASCSVPPHPADGSRDSMASGSPCSARWSGIRIVRSLSHKPMEASRTAITGVRIDHPAPSKASTAILAGAFSVALSRVTLCDRLYGIWLTRIVDSQQYQPVSVAFFGATTAMPR